MIINSIIKGAGKVVLDGIYKTAEGVFQTITTAWGWTSNYRWENVECDGDDLVLSKLEDYRNYTEADANDRFTIEKDKITVTGLQRIDTGHYIYKDAGADYFDGDFEHIIHVKATAHTDGGVFSFWGMANTVNTWNNICSASGNTLELSFLRQDSSTFKFSLIEMVNGSRVENSTTYSLDTDYYIEVERDESIGTYGRIYARIYSDEARTTLVQTLQLNLRAKIDFRYVYAVNNWADGESGSFSGEIEQRNIDLYQELGERVSTPVLIPAHTTSNIQWEKETDEDTDVKVYTGISDSDDEEPPLITGYSYRKKITINGEYGAGTNYQILLKIGESSGSTDDDFHLEGNSEDFPSEKNDGGDLTFSGSDGKTELAFWVEKVSGATPDRTAWVWVKVKEDLGTDKYIYIYYGNDSAENKSDGENTFILFDDFDGDSLDTNKWETNDIGNGSRSFSNSVMTQSVTSGGTRKILPKSNSFGRISMEMLYKNNGARRSLEDCQIIKDSQNIFLLFYENATDIGISTDFLNNNSWQGTHVMEGSSSANAWRIVTINNKGNTSVAGIYDIDRVSKGSDTRNFDLGSSVSLGSFGCRYVNANATVEIDWFFIRKIISTEPSFKEAGTEYPTYTEATNDSTIPDLVANKYLYCKQVLSTKDTSKTPKLNSLKIKIK